MTPPPPGHRRGENQGYAIPRRAGVVDAVGVERIGGTRRSRGEGDTVLQRRKEAAKRARASCCSCEAGRGTLAGRQSADRRSAPLAARPAGFRPPSRERRRGRTRQRRQRLPAVWVADETGNFEAA